VEAVLLPTGVKRSRVALRALIATGESSHARLRPYIRRGTLAAHILQGGAMTARRLCILIVLSCVVSACGGGGGGGGGGGDASDAIALSTTTVKTDWSTIAVWEFDVSGTVQSQEKGDVTMLGTQEFAILPDSPASPVNGLSGWSRVVTQDFSFSDGSVAFQELRDYLYQDASGDIWHLGGETSDSREWWYWRWDQPVGSPQAGMAPYCGPDSMVGQVFSFDWAETTDRDKTGLYEQRKSSRTVVAIEEITVPFGRFEAYRVEERSETADFPVHTLTRRTIWERPEMGILRIEATSTSESDDDTVVMKLTAVLTNHRP
jgi:hypothetical protein